MSDIRKQRLMRELVGGEEGEMPPAGEILMIAGIAMMLNAALISPGADSSQRPAAQAVSQTGGDHAS